MSDPIPIKRALLSVSDKTDLVPFARKLAAYGCMLISTGGTAKKLEEAGLDVVPVEQVTGFPEMMDGRVKTLHPKVHGGLLSLRDNDEHVAAMNEHDIKPIDLVCVNLYPFEQTVARPDIEEAEAIEQIDIGGPSMIRSAAKNFRFVTVLTDPAQYDRVVNELNDNDGAVSLALRQDLAGAAFARTAAYDTAIAAWMSTRRPTQFPVSLLLRFDRHDMLRYGENPHQSAAVYIDPKTTEASVAGARQLHGKALSYNNLYDANGALELVKEIAADDLAAAAVIKHANPCGFAVADNVAEAFDKAYAGDPLAAFGGIVAFNRTVDEPASKKIVEGRKFLEVVIAPEFDDDALELLRERWKNVRLIVTGPLPVPGKRDAREVDLKRITGGLLVQDRDLAAFDAGVWDHVAGPEPTDDDFVNLRLAMMAAKHLKSNAVSLVRDRMLIGGGAGQMDRLAGCRIAVEKAGDRARGACAGSDAFFPFRDGPDALIEAGVKAIIQPGGSRRDEETIEACRENNVTLLFTGRRVFRH